MMKKIVVGSFLIVFLIVFSGGIVWLTVQQNRNSQRLYSKIETFEQRISALEIHPQTLEDVEKMELATKFADANAQVINMELGKFERELRDSNDKWLFAWTGFFGVIIAVILTIIGVAFSFLVKSLIADRVEKNLNGFRKAIDQLDEINNQLKVLHTGHAISVLSHFALHDPTEEVHYREQTALIPEEALLQVFVDETRSMLLRLKAADVLAYRKSSILVAPLLKLLHSIVDDSNNAYYDISTWGRRLIRPLGQIHTQASYQGLKKFLNRLLTENSVYKDFLLRSTVFTLATISSKLNKKDSVSIVRKSIPDLKARSHEEDALINLAEYFYTFNEPEGIIDILTHVLTDQMPNVEIRCLELLKRRWPEYVSDWNKKNATANTENEESS